MSCGIYRNSILLLCLVLSTLACGYEEKQQLSFDGQDIQTEAADLDESVKLTVASESADAWKLKLSNRYTRPVFFVYDNKRLSPDGTRFVVFGRRCKSTDDTSFKENQLNIDLFPGIERLESGNDVFFKVDKPKGFEGECIIRIGYFTDEEAVRLLNEKPFDRSQEESAFTESSINSIEITVTTHDDRR